MILELNKDINPTQIDQLIKQLQWMGLRVHLHKEEDSLSIAIVSSSNKSVDYTKFISLPFVERVHPFKVPFKLVGRDVQTQKKPFKIKSIEIGGQMLAVMAGPCSIESEEQIFESAQIVAAAGANILRGGAYKPRTSPYSFQGLEKEGLQYLQAAAKKYSMLSVTEVINVETVDTVAEYTDILQVGARNMQNFSLLKALGKINKPILLKRGFAATYQDLLMAAEYILSGGNERVILCERGLRTFETYTRNTLDIAAVPILHHLSHLPVIVDPSHGTGIREMVAPMARAAVAAGADGIMVEVHPRPDESFSDAQQTIDGKTFSQLMDSLRIIAPAVNITIPKKLNV